MNQATDLYTTVPSHFLISGPVVTGDKVGRTIGFPTTNLKLDQGELKLKPGVYLSQVTFEYLGETYNKAGLAYYGPRHIFGELQNSFEVYLYDFDQEIYGTVITVQVTHFMRSPIKIKSLDELKNQLQQDKQKGLELLSHQKTL